MVCVANCPDGMWEDTSDLSHVGPVDASSVYEGQGVGPFTDVYGYPLPIGVETGLCSPCDESCSTCTGGGSNADCDDCAPGFYWEYHDSLAGTQTSTTGGALPLPTCERCHESCETCVGGNTEFHCEVEQCKANGCDIFLPERTYNFNDNRYEGAFSSDLFENECFWFDVSKIADSQSHADYFTAVYDGLVASSSYNDTFLTDFDR